MAKAAVESVVTNRQPETERVREWRFQWLFHTGYSVENATKLAAASNVDLHFACDTLRNAQAKGFDEEFVMRLVL